MRPVQYFSKSYLEHCKEMTPDQIARYLEDFRKMQSSKQKASKSKLISLRVPEDLLHKFRKKCELEGMAYQTRIKELMRLSV